MDNLQIMDLFCGIGGFHLGVQRAANHQNINVKCIGAADKDKYAKSAYLKNFPQCKDVFYDDVRDIVASNIPEYDMLLGGFPCQSFSLIGNKEGLLSEEKGGLFYQLHRILDVSQPKSFIFENVRNIVSHDNGQTFATIESLIRSSGYSFHYSIIKAYEFGLPQNRPRTFMVGFRDDLKVDNFKFPDNYSGKNLTLEEVLDVEWCERKVGYTLRVSGRGSKYQDRHNFEYYKIRRFNQKKEEILRINQFHGLKLMGFPSCWNIGPSVTQAMKQLGNSVAVNVVEELTKYMLPYIRT